MKKIFSIAITLLLLAQVAFAETSVRPEKLEVQNSSYKSESLYSSSDSVFMAIHNKVIAAMFGQALFSDFISPSVNAVTLDSIKTMDKTLFANSIHPLPTNLSRIFLSIWLSFFVLAMAYSFIVNVKYYSERTYVFTRKRVGSRESLSGGQEYLLRVVVSLTFLLPMAPYLIGLLMDGEDEEPPLFMSGLFTVLGQTFEHTERVSRIFNQTSEVDTPSYFVPYDDSLAKDFEEVLDYALCVADIRVEGKKEVTAQLGKTGSGNYLYESGFRSESGEKVCRLAVEIPYTAFPASVGAGGFVSEAVQEQLLAHEEEVIRAELDKSLSIFLKASHVVSDEFYKRSKEGVDSQDLVSAVIDSGWTGDCEGVFESVEEGKYGEARNAIPMLPSCASKSYVEAFAYPKGVSELPEEGRFNERIVSLCAFLGSSEMYTSSLEYLDNCTKQVCSTSHLDGKGLTSCTSVLDSNLSFSNVVKERNRGGFFLAPRNFVYDSKDVSVQQNTMNSKAAINGFKAVSIDDTYDTIVTGGEVVFSKTYKRPENKDTSFTDFFDYQVEKKSIDTSDLPTGYSNLFNRFVECVGNEGSFNPKFGVCQPSFSEARIFLLDMTKFMAQGVLFYFVGSEATQMLKASKKKKKNGGVEGEGVDKDMFYYIGTIGLVAGPIATVLGEDFIKSLNWDGIDHFSPYQSVITQDYNASLFATLGALFQSSALGWFFMWVCIMFGVLAFILCLFPMLVFAGAMLHALINLFAFVVSMPFQISDVLSDTGDEAAMNLKNVLVKWVLVLFRFPVVVGGFYLSFFVFDALIEVLPWWDFLGSSDFDKAMSNDMDKIMYLLFSVFYIIVLIGLFMMASFGTAGVAYSIVRQYSGADSRGVEDDELQEGYDMYKQLK